MGLGIVISLWLPAVPDFLGKFEYYNVSIPVAILIWLMIYPMMLKVDFASIKNVGKNPKGLVVTWTVNWLVKPFTMFAISYLFFFIIFKTIIPQEVAKDYLAGAILLGAAPCTAMVFVWSHLTKGNPAHTLVQVATNDLIILPAFAPIVGLLFMLGGIGVKGIGVPWGTLFLSVALFRSDTTCFGMAFKSSHHKAQRQRLFREQIHTQVQQHNYSRAAADTRDHILFPGLKADKTACGHTSDSCSADSADSANILHSIYLWSKAWKLPHDIAAPGAMIGASNFFELAVAVAISVFGLQSSAALATIVGVLVEVPLMLALVRFANKTRHWFPASKQSI